MKSSVKNAQQCKTNRARVRLLKGIALSLCDEFSKEKQELEIIDNEYKNSLETKRMNEERYKDYKKSAEEAYAAKDLTIASILLKKGHTLTSTLPERDRPSYNEVDNNNSVHSNYNQNQIDIDVIRNRVQKTRAGTKKLTETINILNQGLSGLKQERTIKEVNCKNLNEKNDEFKKYFDDYQKLIDGTLTDKNLYILNSFYDGVDNNNLLITNYYTDYQ
ncbi:1626_t:CDS:2 [Ambispora leptoticha]|uniref:1626_t:CDS:1 n=1 Tax=Ambispora leptoticha TaxID=144679 RepID=A0A9N9FZA4_9GLOM|nr:1626_t:CDS:2 [Ambispora leptoticha]